MDGIVLLYHDPSDCDEVCGNCGHSCCKHGYDGSYDCLVDGCECIDWVDVVSQ